MASYCWLSFLIIELWATLCHRETKMWCEQENILHPSHHDFIISFIIFDHEVKLFPVFIDSTEMF